MGVRVDNPGINYNCAEDTVVMKPDLGYKLEPVCGPFGRITSISLTPPPQIPFLETPGEEPPPRRPYVPPLPPPTGDYPTNLDRTPEITVKSKTGINAKLKPILKPIVVPPIVPPPPGLIQVTDLAGIKQTGYYDGRAYYGAIHYKDGVKYAGWYETSGQLIQIYDTLQESIDARVTTAASAIQRQGSDVTSNDPRLNIPGTPDNLT